MFWKNGKLSTEGKIAIGVSSLFVFCLIVLLVYIYIRRRRNDYDFALPHELTGNYEFKINVEMENIFLNFISKIY